VTRERVVELAVVIACALAAFLLVMLPSMCVGVL
jgi:hypothetical protein